MIYIVYQTINTVNNKIYIGVHKVASLDFDGYIGCGVYINDSHSYKNPTTNFQYAVKKYGPSSFKRTVLKAFDNEIDALDLERRLVDEAFVKRPDTYNMILGGGRLEPSNKEETYVYDVNGNYIQSFISRTDASEFIYGDRKHAGNISRAVHYGGFCKQYQVSSVKLPYMKNYKAYKKEVYKQIVTTIKEKYTDGKILQFTNPKKIAQYDLDGNLIKIWDSLNQCRKAGFTNVQAVVEGKRNQCKGFTFNYYKD
jgi:hypothetical protein